MLKTPINISYELETQETGNMVIQQDDFYKFDEKVKAAKTITDDYEYYAWRRQKR